MNDEISTTISAEAPQNSSQDSQLLPRVVEMASTERNGHHQLVKMSKNGRAQKDRRYRLVSTLQRRVYQHGETISASLRWTSRPDFNG